MVIDKANDHRINRSRLNRYTKVGELLYRVRWLGSEAGDDTCDPTNHLPRSKVLSYYKSKKMPALDTIYQADDG